MTEFDCYSKLYGKTLAYLVYTWKRHWFNKKGECYRCEVERDGK